MMLSGLHLGWTPCCREPFIGDPTVVGHCRCGRPVLDRGVRRAVFPYRLQSGVYHGLRDSWHVIKIGQVGMADVGMVLAPRGRSAFLEMKSPTGRLTPDQKRWRDVVTQYGALWALARSAQEAKVVVCDWLLGEAKC